MKTRYVTYLNDGWHCFDDGIVLMMGGIVLMAGDVA
jgi:hypothetical protein